MPPAWSIQAFEGPQGLCALESDWRRLLAEMPDHGPQHRYETHHAYFGHVSTAGGRHVCLALSDGVRIRAICPIEPGRMMVFGRPLPVMELPGRLWDLNRDLVCPPGPAEARLLPAVRAWLRHRPGTPPWLVLDHVLDDSAASRCVRALPAHAWCAAEREVSAVFDCGAAAPGPGTTPSRKFRANLRAAERRLAAAGTVRFQRHRGATDLPAAYRAFLDLEAAGWKGRDGAHGAVTLKPAERAFYDEIVAGSARGGAARDACTVHALYLDDVCIAAALCMLGAGEMAMPKIAYDERHARLAPGQLLLQWTLGVCRDDATVHRLNMVSNAAWLAAWRPRGLVQRRVVIGLNPLSSTLGISLLRAGEAAWPRLRGSLQAVRRRSAPGDDTATPR